MPALRRFHVVGLEVELRSRLADGLDTLAGHYDHYPPTGAAPDVVLEIERTPGFADGRTRGPSYPAFETRLAGGRLVLDRFDARGEVELASSPLAGRFEVGDSPNSLEAVVRIALSIALPRRGSLIFHSSCVADRRGAHLFSGVSGAGKSTIAAMLAEAYPDTTVKLADELVIAACTEGRWRAHVAPFLGIAGLPHGESRPLASIELLEQAPRHERLPVQRATAMRELLRHVLVYARDASTAAQVLGALDDLTASVPCARLRFAKDPGVAEVLGIT